MDPITIAALGGGLLRGVTSLFGESEEEKRNKQRQRLLQAIRDQQAGNKERAQKDKERMDRELSSEKADRRNVLSQKLAQYGYEPGGSIATNEKDLVLGNIKGKGDIEARLEEANALLQRQAGDVNAGIECEPDPFGTFVSEAIGGAAEGINFGKALGFLDPGKARPGGNSLNTAPSKYDTPVTNPEINTSELTKGLNFSLMGEGDNTGVNNLSLLGEGNNSMMDDIGFEFDPKLLSTEGMGGDLAGYKNPFKKFNNAYRLLNR